MDDDPKSALQLALERLKRQDSEAGTVERTLTDQQKAEIAEARQVYASRLAQADILHKSAMVATFEPQERQKREDEYRRDVQRLHEERDRKIEAIRQQSG